MHWRERNFSDPVQCPLSTVGQIAVTIRSAIWSERTLASRKERRAWWGTRGNIRKWEYKWKSREFINYVKEVAVLFSCGQRAINVNVDFFERLRRFDEITQPAFRRRFDVDSTSLRDVEKKLDMEVGSTSRSRRRFDGVKWRPIDVNTTLFRRRYNVSWTFIYIQLYVSLIFDRAWRDKLLLYVYRYAAARRVKKT